MKKIALGIVITVVLLTNQAGISQPLEQILQQSDLLMRTGQQTESLRLLRDGAITAQVQAAHPDLARLLLAEAENHYYFFHFDSAYTVAKEALTLAEKYQLEALLPAVYLQIGIAAMKSKYYEEALNYMSKAYTQAKEKGQELLILQADAYTEDISGIYNYHQGLLNTNVAQDAYERALKPLEASQDTSLYLSFLLRYADMYRNTGSLDSFQLLIQQAETTLENFQDIRAELKVLIMKSIHQSLLENWAAEEFYIRQALQKVLRLGTFPQLVQHYYFRLHFTYKERKQWNKAIEMLDSANLIETKLLLTGHDLYAQVYKEKGDDTKALEHYEKWMALRDSVLQTEKLSLITEWETKYDLQQKDLELEQQRSRQNLLIGGLVFLSFFGFLLFRAYRNKNKLNQELRSQKQKIEQQAEELRSLDRIKSNFFANVSHELRTPLTMILGPAELALKSKRLAQKEQKLIILVKKNSQKLLQLVNEILDLAKLEQSKLALEEKAVNFYSLNRRILSSFDSYAAVNAWRFSFDYQADYHLKLYLDSNKYEKIINNLLSNAFKFTPKGGQIEVCVQVIENKVKISVKDTGRGIAPEEITHVFDRFYQGNQKAKIAEGGTGIGLALSREFAKMMNGKIWVESELHQGSTFFFEFPKKEAFGQVEEIVAATAITATPTVPAIASNSESTKVTILLVEDDPDLRAYIQMILAEYYQILTATNGMEALDRLNANSEHPIADLIISDIMMPQMDGFQLLEVLKSRAYYQQIPVIMLTARAALEDRLKALRIGVDDYMTKPFEAEELLVRIQNLLKNAAERIQWAKEVESALEAEAVTTANKQTLSTREQAWLEQVESLVLNHLHQYEFSIDLLAENLQTNRTQLYRKLKKMTGLSPSEYIRAARLHQAKILLENRTHTSVKAVVHAVGLKHTGNFSKLFQAQYGKLPSDYFE